VTAKAGRLEGRTVLITGAGSGIGRSAAVLFASEGASIGILDRNALAANETCDLIESLGATAFPVPADVTSRSEVDIAVASVVGRFGRLDVLFNNAGVDSGGSIEEATDDDWDRVFAVNVKGVFLASQAAIPHLEVRGGTIINQGSVAALVGIPRLAAYCAAKGAVVSLTRSMAVDLAPKGIRVNVICPGTVFTPLIEPLIRARGNGDFEAGLALTVAKYPIGRLGTADEIANVALFLATDESAFLTGSVITADGGMTAI
jgi:NAD(P)-dependent dehydrogenase (short-subunit alcohol dehydrogenase family)